MMSGGALARLQAVSKREPGDHRRYVYGARQEYDLEGIAGDPLVVVCWPTHPSTGSEQT